jgi:hypothetical protein
MTSSEHSLTDAYAAGLIDGEGCISVSRHSTKSGYIYAVRVEVGMSIKAMTVLQWLAKHFGGTIRKTRKGSQQWAEAHAWGLFGQKATPFLMRILPLLKLKQEQAKLGISLQHLATDGWTEQNRLRGAKIWESMKLLNLKGPEQSSESCSLARLAEGTWTKDQRTLFDPTGWESFYGPWPKQGSMRNGSAYVRPMWVPATAEIAGSASPTARSEDAENCGNYPLATDSLTGATRQWATPNAHDGRRPTDDKSTQGRNLQREVDLLWQTPSSNLGGNKCRSGNRQDELLLDGQAKHWATPQAFDAQDIQHSAEALKKAKTKGGCCNLREQVSLPPDQQIHNGHPSSNNPHTSRPRLNPMFTEFLMGAPPGWTTPAPTSFVASAMPSWFSKLRSLLQNSLKDSYP